MASYSSLFSSGAGRLILDVNTESYSIENNNSIVKCVLRLEKLLAYSSYNYINVEISMTINGQVLFTQDYFDVRNMNVGDIHTFATKSITINHAADGKQSIAVAAVCKTGVQFGSATISDTFTCADIPRQAKLTAAPNFTDEENPVITYTNPAGNLVTTLQACISLTGGNDDIAYRDISKTGTSYTFELTDAEREILRNATLSGSDSRNVEFYIKTIINGVTYWHNQQKTLTIVNATPTIAPTVIDMNEITAAITGDSSKFVSGYSNLGYSFNATTYKGASITSYSVTCGSLKGDKSVGILNTIAANKVTFIATDSRGLTATKEITITLLPYEAVTCDASATIEMDGETTARVEISAKGHITATIGDTNNATNHFQVFIMHTGLEEWLDLTPIIDVVFDREKNTYSFDFGVSELDYSKAFTYQIKVIDVLTEYTTKEDTLKIIPVFDWSETDFNFNVPVSFQGETMADIVVETGTEDMGSNGTWYWRKWQSGRAECYGLRNYGNMAISTAWGSLYMSDTFDQDLPIGLFAAAPDYVGINTSYGAFIIGSSATAPSEYSTGGFRVVRAVAETAQQVKLRFNVIGRWK